MDANIVLQVHSFVAGNHGKVQKTLFNVPNVTMCDPAKSCKSSLDKHKFFVMHVV
jgi:hypothetical protein